MSSGLPEMPCSEFVEQVTNYLEDALAPSDRTRLEEHLAVCSHCAHYLGQLQTIRERAGKLDETDVTPQMRGDLLHAFSRWQQER